MIEWLVLGFCKMGNMTTGGRGPIPKHPKNDGGVQHFWSLNQLGVLVGGASTYFIHF